MAKKPDPIFDFANWLANNAKGGIGQQASSIPQLQPGGGVANVVLGRGQAGGLVNPQLLAQQAAARRQAQIVAANNQQAQQHAQQLQQQMAQQNAANQMQSLIPSIGSEITDRRGIFTNVRESYLNSPVKTGTELKLPPGLESKHFSGITALATAPGQQQDRTVADFLNKYTVPDKALAPSRIAVDVPSGKPSDVLQSPVSKDASGKVQFNAASPTLNALFPNAGDLGLKPLTGNPAQKKASEEALNKATDEATARIAAGVRRKVMAGTGRNLQQIQNEAVREADVSPEVRANYNLRAADAEAKALAVQSAQSRESRRNNNLLPIPSLTDGQLRFKPLKLGRVEDLANQFVLDPAKQAVTNPLGFLGSLAKSSVQPLFSVDVAGDTQAGSEAAKKKLGIRYAPKPSTAEGLIAALTLGKALKTTVAGRALRTPTPTTAPAAGTVGINDIFTPRVLNEINPPRKFNAEKSVISSVRAKADRPVNSISSIGPEGQQLANMVRDYRDLNSTIRGHLDAHSPSALGTGIRGKQALSKADYENWVDVIEGKAKPRNAIVARAAKETQGGTSQAFQFIQESGFPTQLRQNFFPHNTFDPKIFTPGTPPNKAALAQAKSFLKEGGHKNPSDAEAMTLLRRSVADENVPQYKAGSIMNPRQFDLPGYSKTPQALHTYNRQVADTVASRKILGDNFANVDKKLNEIELKYGRPTRQHAEELFKIAMDEHRGKGGALGAVRTGISAARLQRSFAPNATQLPINTGTVVGVRNMAKATRDFLKDPEVQKRALQAGVTDREALKNVREGYAGSGVVAPGFNIEEEINRGATYTAGERFAKQEASRAVRGNKIAEQHLKDMGLDSQSIIKRKGELTNSELIRAGRNHVEREQFLVDTQDLPPAVTTSGGRTAFQFRNFPLQQSYFLARELGREAKRGNLAPAARYAALSPVLGTGANSLQKLLALQNPAEQAQKDPLKFALDSVSKGGGLGLPFDTARGVVDDVRHGFTPEGKALNVATDLGGPTAGLAGQLGTGIAEALGKNGDSTSLKHTLLGTTPLVGPAIANLFAPYQTNKEKTGAIDKMTETYNTLAKEGLVGTGELSFTEDEKKIISKYIDGKGNLRQSDLDKALGKLGGGNLTKTRDALIKYQALLQGGSGATADIFSLTQRINSGDKLSFDQFTTQRKINDELTDQQLGGKQNFADFIKGSGDQQALYLKYLEQTQGKEAADTFIAQAQQYVNQAAAAGRTNLDTGAEQMKVQDTVSRANATRPFSEAVLDYTGLSDAQQRRLIANGGATNDFAPQGDAFQQALINMGIISPYTKGNQTWQPGQAIFTGKGQNRLGINPQDILSGAASIKRSGGGSGGSRGRGGKRSGGGRKGGSKSSKTRITKGRAGKKLTFKKSTIPPFVLPKSKKKPLTFAQILKQVS